jgi:hypothetical protein
LCTGAQPVAAPAGDAGPATTLRSMTGARNEAATSATNRLPAARDCARVEKNEGNGPA